MMYARFGRALPGIHRLLIHSVGSYKSRPWVDVPRRFPACSLGFQEHSLPLSPLPLAIDLGELLCESGT